MANIKDPNFNKNVSMVYVEELGFTGYKGFDFSKIDSIEDILTGVGGLGPNSYLSGIQNATQSINNKLFVTGDFMRGTLVYQADLSQQFDAVTTFPEQSTGINNYTPSGVNGTVLKYNPYRKELYVQNLATEILYVKYGAGASDTSFNFVLAANTATNAGDGGSLSDKGYNGDVSVSGINGTNSPRYIFWERSSPKAPSI
jgi:hypothetical protein